MSWSVVFVFPVWFWSSCLLVFFALYIFLSFLSPLDFVTCVSLSFLPLIVLTCSHLTPSWINSPYLPLSLSGHCFFMAFVLESVLLFHIFPKFSSWFFPSRFLVCISPFWLIFPFDATLLLVLFIFLNKYFSDLQPGVVCILGPASSSPPPTGPETADLARCLQAATNMPSLSFCRRTKKGILGRSENVWFFGFF